jgi:hypothetical protein
MRTVLVALAGAALVLGGLAALLASSGGSAGGIQPPTIAPARQASGTAPLPPHGALVLAARDRTLAVALAARRQGGRVLLEATVLGGDGSGVDGLDVGFAIDGRAPLAGRSCGHGCYSVATPSSRRVRQVDVHLQGRGHAPSHVVFTLPARWPVPATALVRRAQRAFRHLRSVVYTEHLASGAGAAITTLWRTEAPDLLTYRISNGVRAVVIGKHRWDLTPGAGWQRSLQNPPLQLPAPAWGPGFYDASVLATGPAFVRVSFVDPETPAWYDVTFERGTLHPTALDMVGAAHFMHHHYLRFNAPLRIRPPT